MTLDGATGDGTSQGHCPAHNCLSNGYCNVCGLISGYAEGCDIFSTSPVCDANQDTTAIEDSAGDWPYGSSTILQRYAKCVQCKKSGKIQFFTQTGMLDVKC